MHTLVRPPSSLAGAFGAIVIIVIGMGGCSSGSSGGANSSFACVGNVTATKPTEAQATFSAVLTELGNEKPVANANVTMCAVIDMTCAAPITKGTTGPDGTISLTVPMGPNGFDGYGKIEISGYQPLLEFAGPPPTGPTASPFKLTMVPASAFDSFLSSADAASNPDRGHVAVRALDCAGNVASGVTVKLSNADAKTKTVYVSDLGVPIKDALATDPSGRAVILNAPIGATTVVATLASNDQTIGKRQLVVQKGFLTATTLPPTP